jgi:hypothetical protein
MRIPLAAGPAHVLLTPHSAAFFHAGSGGDGASAQRSNAVRIASLVRSRHVDDTNWTSIRLELARTHDFPEGSARHAYLLRLPLAGDGLIDATAFSLSPAMATAHRFWPDEPDRSGYVVRTPAGWALSYEPGDADDEVVFHLETHPIRVGEYLTLTEPDGSQLPFRVASVNALGHGQAA